MRKVESKAEVREAVRDVRCSGGTIGVVPTMGYFHEGHLSLVRRAREETTFVILTIFVNPTQFGPEEDLARYPRDLEHDLARAREEGVDLVFAPSEEEMYGPEHATWVEVEGLTEGLCGSSRPSHFRGVTTVVSKLFNICRPDAAYFGQKDGQQALVVERMAADLDTGARIVICPIVRGEDGVAVSSRNVYLSEEERGQAPALHRALREGAGRVEAGERDPRAVKELVEDRISEAPLAAIDYVEIVRTSDLRPPGRLEGRILIAVAVWFGQTRLIDNVILDVTSSPT